MASCAHFQSLLSSYYHEPVLSGDLRSKLIKIVKESRCQVCGKGLTRHLCLNPACLSVGCGRRDKGHALQHFQINNGRNGNHATALDLADLHVWCYVCDDYVVSSRDHFEWLKEASSIDQSSAADTSSRKLRNSKLPSVGTLLLLPNIVSLAGLQNIGNTCYMNAALQIMLNCPSIKGYFTSCSQFVLNRSQRDISEAFLELCNSIYCQTSPGVVCPKSIVREIKAVNPMFEGYSQQDTMDFMRCLWDRIHEELSDSISNTADTSAHSKIRRSDRLKPSQSHQSFTPFIPKSHSIISDTFGGVLRSRIDCLVCKNVSIKDDLFFDLSLPIVLHNPPSQSEPSPSISSTSSSAHSASASSGPPKSPTLEYMGSFFTSIGESLGFSGRNTRLESCLAAFCCPERLEGRDRYYCERCKVKVPSLKTLSLKELPNVLCIQLKRFRHESFFSSKVNTLVSFPLDNLDLSPFINGEDLQGRNDFAGDLYELIGVINHLGSFGGGHYTAFCKHPNMGVWLKFDDSYVCEVSDESIVSSQAYCLMYKRKFEERRLMNDNCTDGESTAISRQWLNNWKYLASPGPMNSSELVCPHGKILPEMIKSPELITSLVIDISQASAEHLKEEFGEICPSTIAPPFTICPECLQLRKELESRRRNEAEAIAELDTRQIDSVSGERWFLINTHWLNEFIAFRDGRQRHPPGPISNDRLLEKDGATPKGGLRRGISYRAVNSQVWDYLFGRYGGGPAIVRDTIDIYGPSAISNSSSTKKKSVSINIPVRIEGTDNDSSSSDVPYSSSPSFDAESPRRTSPRRHPSHGY